MMDTAQFGKFGKIILYRTSPEPSNVVLFISGDGGWSKGVENMAIALAEMDSLVIGINLPRYMGQLNSGKGKCGYPAGDFEMLAQFVQKKLNYKTYHYPVMVGYSSGATLAYEIIAQAPPEVLSGPSAWVSVRTWIWQNRHAGGTVWSPSRGLRDRGYVFLPQANLETPWIVLQGKIDQVCYPAQTINFVKKTGSARIVLLPKVGHGYSVQANWMPQFKQAYAELVDEKGVGGRSRRKKN